MYAFFEECFGHGRDRDHLRRVCHSNSISFGAEDGDLVVWGAEGFHALIGLLAVVQGWCHAVKSQEGVSDELGFRPSTRLDAEVGLDMSIDCLSVS